MLGIILNHHNMNEDKGISLGLLERKSRLSENTITKYLDTLEDKGLIVTTTTGYRKSFKATNDYIPQYEVIDSFLSGNINTEEKHTSNFAVKHTSNFADKNNIYKKPCYVKINNNSNIFMTSNVENLNKSEVNAGERNATQITDKANNPTTGGNSILLEVPTVGSPNEQRVFIVSSDGRDNAAISSIPTPLELPIPSSGIREADKWEYRTTKDRCWKETMDKAMFNGMPDNEADMRKLMNAVYFDWQTKNDAMNDRMLNEMIQYASVKCGITITRTKTNKRQFNVPMRNTNAPTLTEIQNLSLTKIQYNPDALERLALAANNDFVMCEAMSRAIEYLQIYRHVEYHICCVWYNALATLQKSADKMSDTKFEYCCLMMGKLEQAISDCGGRSMFDELGKTKYKSVMEVV